MVSEAQVQRLIDEHKETIFACHIRAWERYKALCALDPANSIAYTARTQASILHDFICDELNKAFDTSDQVVPHRSRGKFQVLVGDSLNMRFKRLNRQGLPNSNRTRSEAQWTTQLQLPGFSHMTKVTIGYKLDPTQTEMEDVLVLYQEANAIQWTFSLKEGLTRQGTIVEALPSVDERAATEATPIRRVIPKEKRKEQKES